MAEEYPVVLEDVTFTYEGAEEPAIKNVNLKVKRGELVAVVGRTGAGKSTAIYAIGGIIPNYIHGDLSGDIIIEGLKNRQQCAGVFLEACFGDHFHFLYSTATLGYFLRIVFSERFASLNVSSRTMGPLKEAGKK